MNKPKTILLINDVVPVLKALSNQLEAKGFKCITVSDGKSGLESALRYHPNLIVMGVILPKMGGLTLLRLLRKDHWGKNVPVIIFTSLDGLESVFKGDAGRKLNYWTFNESRFASAVDSITKKLKHA